VTVYWKPQEQIGPFFANLATFESPMHFFEKNSVASKCGIFGYFLLKHFY
jgi:hypothetical protein